MKKQFYLISLMAALLLASCTKEVLVTQGKLIAETEVSAAKGSFPVAIATTGVWQAIALDEWLHVDESLVEGNYAVMIHHDSNESTAARRNFNRVGHVVIATHDKYTADTIRVKQRGLTPFMNLTDVVAEAYEVEAQVPFDTNLTSEQHPSIVCRATESWVRSVAIASNNKALDVVFGENTGVERQSTIEVTFTDAWGDATTVYCTLTQKQSE
ncbi:MAG: BACON domain-containing protein [Alistipes sp.]|nr:BACON domain-containing protein [Alistipes sp.]